MQENTSLHSL